MTSMIVRAALAGGACGTENVYRPDTSRHSPWRRRLRDGYRWPSYSSPSARTVARTTAPLYLRVSTDPAGGRRGSRAAPAASAGTAG